MNGPRQADANFEITDEMIKAGKEAFEDVMWQIAGYDLPPTDDQSRLLLASVFRAMAALSPLSRR